MDNIISRIICYNHFVSQYYNSLLCIKLPSFAESFRRAKRKAKQAFQGELWFIPILFKPPHSPIFCSNILKNVGTWYTRSMFTHRQLERIVRGFSNHRRIQILSVVHESPELSVSEIAGELRINIKTASEHIRRLAISGLILKRNQGKNVRHKLSDRGVIILTFLRTLE